MTGTVKLGEYERVYLPERRTVKNTKQLLYVLSSQKFKTWTSHI